jgi:hypothetical protein
MNQLPIGHTLADQLIKAGHLKSVIVAAPGSKRGVRLVEAASLQEYLGGLPTSLPKLVRNQKLALEKTGRPKRVRGVAKGVAQ